VWDERLCPGYTLREYRHGGNQFFPVDHHVRPQSQPVGAGYNGEKFLAECLDLALAQNFTDMEVLVADDGSTMAV